MKDQQDKDAILGILDHIVDQLDGFLADAQESGRKKLATAIAQERLEVRRRQWRIAHD